MAKRDGVTLYSDSAITVTYYPKNGNVCVCDNEAPAMSDSCTFFDARPFLEMVCSVAKRLPKEMGDGKA
jgi:hypothetical protein